MAKRLYVDGVNCSRLILDTLVTSTLSTLRSTLNRKLSYVLVKEDNSNYSITGAADWAVFEEGELARFYRGRGAGNPPQSDFAVVWMTIVLYMCWYFDCAKDG